LPHLPAAEKLALNRQVTVVLRLLIDRRGQLLHGELVDDDGKPWRRFAGWRELTGTIREWLARRTLETSSLEPQDPDNNREADPRPSE
jgi:hypothetical protein